MINEHSRICSLCRALVNDPAATVCSACGRPMVPHHSRWSPVLKWWLCVEFVRSRFFSWKGSQDVWEELLRDALNGSRGYPTIPERTRLGVTDSTPASTLYPLALERATAWRKEGSPIERPVSAARGAA